MQPGFSLLLIANVKEKRYGIKGTVKQKRKQNLMFWKLLSLST